MSSESGNRAFMCAVSSHTSPRDTLDIKATLTDQAGQTIHFEKQGRGQSLVSQAFAPTLTGLADHTRHGDTQDLPSSERLNRSILDGEIDGPVNGLSLIKENVGHLKIQCFNVGGLKGRLDDPEFRAVLKDYDLTLLSETHLDDADNDLVSEKLRSVNLSVKFKNRKALSTYRSGGLCIIYSHVISNHISFIESNCELVQWIKISKTILSLDKDVLLGNTYIPPEHTRYQNLTPFQELQEEILKFDDYYICIAGDLNSRTNTLRDYIVRNDFVPEQFEFDEDAQNGLTSLNLLTSNDISLDRQNSDTKVANNYGRLLIDFCKSNNLLFANGRLGSDITGKATTYNHTVLDYMITNPNLLINTENFTVHDYDAVFSDIHCRLSWGFRLSNTNLITNCNSSDPKTITIKKSHRGMWSKVKPTDFTSYLDVNRLNDISQDITNPHSNVYQIVNKIQELFKHAADSALGPEYEIKFEVSANRESKPIKFSRETLNKRNRYYKAKRLNNGTEEKRNELKIASKEYRKAVSKEKALHRKQRIRMLRNAKSKDPKFYWSVLSSKHKIVNTRGISPNLDFFYEKFKELAGNESHGEYRGDDNEVLDEGQYSNEIREIAEQILNIEFTVEEIFACVKALKNGKACSTDMILNEFIKSTFDKMKEIYVGLFNRILNEGQIPESWTIGMIVPIYKNKGEKDDFNSYRGITLLSCLGKLFTSVINSRLNRFADETKLINENQTGFRKNYSTLDHVFLLKNLIDLNVKNDKQKLYCAFIDYKKAFDTVWRSALWHKLVKSGITGKLYNVITNMYSNIKSCVSHNGQLSDYFASVNGVRQGENLSPFLFALFINDIEEYLTQNGCDSIQVTGADVQTYLKLLVIMYADDTVLFANSKEGLQKCLDSLQLYCDKWKLQVNADKTKVLVFANRKINKANINFTIGGKNVEIVDEFKYLGVKLSYNGNFHTNIKDLKVQGNRALFSIVKTARRENLPVDIQFELFDRMVIPVILYGCEIWGYKKMIILEQLHLKFCKMVLKLKQSTPDVMVYGESGRLCLEYYAKKRMINFWSNIVLGNENKLSYTIYSLCKHRYDNGLPTSEWFLNIVNLLNSYGIQTMPESIVGIKAVVRQVHIALKHEYLSKWETKINNSPKCSTLYKHIKTVFEREHYLTNLPYNLRIALSRLRTSNHKLPVESGRYRRNYVPRESRFCTKCDSGQMGDEYHFLLVCTNPELIALRERYISPYYVINPNMDKLTELFNNQGQKLLKLARYIKEGLKLF